MSLINEALRRTRDAANQSTNKPAGADPLAAYQIETAPKPKPQGDPLDRLHHSPNRSRLILTALLSLICLGGLLWATYKFAVIFPRSRMDYMPATSTPPSLIPQPFPDEPHQPATEILLNTENGIAPPNLLPSQPAPVLAPPKPAPTAALPPAAPAVVPAPAVPPEPPKLKVTGFSSVGSIREAMINGRTLRVGDSILGARILAIKNPVVTYEFNGREYEVSSHDE